MVERTRRRHALQIERRHILCNVEPNCEFLTVGRLEVDDISITDVDEPGTRRNGD
jgi:hypothetical protein